MPPKLRSRLGNYPELRRAAAQGIPGADLGHAPQMSDPERFDKALLAGISSP